MEKQCTPNTISHVLLITIIISLAILSFALCIVCEINKSQNELRVDGDLCYLPRSKTLAYGIAALASSFLAQGLGTAFFVFCRRSTPSNSSFAPILFFLSWTSFLIMVILMGTATSMSRQQGYGEGWLDGKCYLVKNGIYVCSGILVIIAITLTLLSCYLTLNKSQVVHAQVK